MNVIVPGPMKVMKWIEQEVGKAIDRGATCLTWVTPSGFTVKQKLMKPKIQRIELQLMGCVNTRVATEDGDKVDKNHHKNATAPNLIHSLDASLLHLSALRFNAPLSSYTTRYFVVLLTCLFYQPLFVRHTCTYLRSMTT